MQDINIPYNEYQTLISKLEAQYNKILELEQNQQKIILETEQHVYQHTNGTNAVDLITRDIRYINLDEFKEIYKQEIYKEIDNKFQIQLTDKSKTIDILTTQNKTCLDKLSKYQTEVNTLRNEKDSVINKSMKIEEQYKQLLKTNSDKYKIDIETLESKYNSKILEANAIKQKNLTIESLRAERDLTIRQLQIVRETVKQYKDEIHVYKTKRNIFQKIFNK